MYAKTWKNFLFFLLVGFSSFDLAASANDVGDSASINWNRVYLASFPRSGNHWVRFLIEEATHIATSSVSRDADYPHLPTLFPWGGYSTDHGYLGNCRYPTQHDPAVIKTHHPYYWNPVEAGRVIICVIRHPVDAFYSFCEYEGMLDDQRQVPEEVLHHFIKKWREFYEYWAQQPGVLLVRYEDLYQQPAFYLEKIINTIGYSVQQEDIDRAVDKYPPRGAILKHLCHYTEKDLELIRKELGDLLSQYDYSFYTACDSKSEELPCHLPILE